MVLRNVATNYTFEQQRQEINLLADDVNAIDSEVTTLQGEVTTLQSNVTSIQSLQGTESTDSPTFNNLTVSGYISGPASMTIDPAAVGDNTGTLVIAGNLQVDGVTTTVNSETLTVSDKNITLASNATDNSTANGAGLTVAGANATLNYNGTTDEWEFNKNLRLVSANIFCVNVEPSNNIQLTDDKKILFGSSNDLKIFHDGTDSFITNDTGQLVLRVASVENALVANPSGSVVLYHSNSPKFETHSNGVLTSGRLFINSTNAGFDYNSVADTLEVLTTNGSTHSEFTSSAFLPAASNSKGLGANTKRWSNVYVSNAIYLNDRIIWGSYPSSQEPTGVNEGDQYYNTTDSKMKIYDGSNWVDFGGGSSGVTTTISKSSSHDIWCENSGMGTSCSTTNRTGVSHSSSTTVTMTFTFSVGVGSITEFKMGLATPNGFNIEYAFNNGSFASTGHNGSSCTEVDLTSDAQSAGTVTTFKLRGGSGSGNTHIYMSYWKINGTYIVGSFEDNSQQLTVTI